MPKEPKIDYAPGGFIVASVTRPGTDGLPSWSVWRVSEDQSAATVGRVQGTLVPYESVTLARDIHTSIPKATVFGSYVSAKAAYFVADRLIELDYVCAGMRSNLDQWRKDAQNALRGIADAI